MLVVFWLLVGVLPLGLSIWALLDCARRPPWAWSFAGKSQLAWLGAICFGVLLLIFGVVISLWYLIRIRPMIAAVEAGDFAGFEP